MARYLDETQAAADGYRIVHEPDRHRFAIYLDGAAEGASTSTASGAGEDADPPGRLMGEAHYSLLGDEAIDFDHTIVSPELRGTGIASLLAQRALTSDVAGGRRLLASCWFIRGYLEKHPELRGA